MATVTATAQVETTTPRWTVLLAYLAAVIVAETLIAIPAGSQGLDRPFQSIGLGIHILLVFTLLFLSVLLQPKDATLASLVVSRLTGDRVRVDPARGRVTVLPRSD